MSHPHTSRTALATSRREFLERLTLLLGGAAVSAPVSAGILARLETKAANPGQQAPATHSLGSSERALAEALAECILPRTETPGAADAGVASFIDEIVSDYFDASDQDLYRRGLSQLDRRAELRFGSSFIESTKADQESLVQELDRHTFGRPVDQQANAELGEDDARFFRFHKELTVAGYYTSEVGLTQELRQRHYGPFRGDVELLEGQKAWAR